MRAEIAMKRIEAIPSFSKSRKKLNGLFRLLTCRDLWYRAYEKIAPNAGAMTPGADGETFDGFSPDWVEGIITKVLTGTYEPTPVRRVYIPKANGKLRALGIPTVADRLVQEVVRSILEKVYEPVFSQRSHGFRPGRSCHTALKHIKDVWTGVKWLVEVDIKGFFDNIDHDTMMNLLAKKVDDKRFLRLIHTFLTAGYLEDWQFHDSYSGTPQGGVISPLLANVYLHELDWFMYRWAKDHDRGDERAQNLAYNRIHNKVGRRRRKLEQIRETATADELKTLEEDIASLSKLQRSMPSMDPMDPLYRRYRYIRYADDFLIGVIGCKEDAMKVMAAVRDFVRTLKLEVAEEKSGVVHASKGTIFLGYEIGTYTPKRSKWIAGRTGLVHKRAPANIVYLAVPPEKARKFCISKRYGDLDTLKGAHRADLQDSSEVEIAAQYNAEFRGLAQYYALAWNVKKAFQPLQCVEQGSLLATIAHKHRSSRKTVKEQMMAPDGEWYATSYGHGTEAKRMQVWRLKHLERPNPYSASLDRAPKHNLAWGRTDLVDRLLAKECANCGTTERPVEVHHVRKLADHKKKADFVLFIRTARTRKRIPLCRDCHHDLHAGRLQDFRARMKQEVESRVQ